MTTPGKDASPAKPKLGAVLLIDDEKPLLALFQEALEPRCKANRSNRSAPMVRMARSSAGLLRVWGRCSQVGLER